jgi:ureidoglycolate dehydrogenase (NAD+)
MPQIQSESRTYRDDVLRKFVAALLKAADLRDADAELIADSLVEANLRGIDSHGTARIGHYLERLRRKSIKARPDIRFEKLAAATGRVHGDDGMGQLAMSRATDEAIALARDAGAGWVSVCRSSHCGMLAYYGLRIAEAGMVGFTFTHVESLVVPYASRQPFCGTNPICITAPGTNNRTLCLDMATSVVPWNTVKNASIEGVTMPQGWAVDGDGNDTTDPDAAAAVHAMGEYKGSGLGLMIDVLCAMLGGAPNGPDINPMYGDMDKPRLLGGLVGAIDISTFGDAQAFGDRIAQLAQRWNALPPIDDDNPVLYPGQPEITNKQHRLMHGIPIGVGVVKQFNELAAQYGLEPFDSQA